MSYQNLLLTREDATLIITLNRPAQMNALDMASLDELSQVLREAQGNAEVRNLIIAGGEKFFCVGADISEVNKINSAFAGYRFSKNFQRCFAQIEELDKIAIAAVRGYALGGGLELMLACDFRIVADDAQLGVPEVNLGALPGGGGTAKLPRLIGSLQAKELLLLGEPISGQVAAQLGMVNKAVPATEVLSEAKALARKLAQRSPLALQVIKSAVRESMNVDLNSALEFEARGLGFLATSEDFKEGTAAFLQKRRPTFKGL